MENAKILVVEDERITAEDIKRSLEKAGYNILDIVATGEEAMKSSEKNNPDLVLMDIVLDGKIDGIEAAETIRNKYNIPIIYLTAYSDKKTLERIKTTNPSAYILKEPFGFLHKPFEENELYTAIDIILKRDYAEKKLKNNDLIISLFQYVSDGLIILDSQKRIKFMNSSAEKLTGFKIKESYEKNYNEIFRVKGLKIDSSDECFLGELTEGDVILKSKKDITWKIEGKIIPVDDKNCIDGNIVIIFRKQNE
jgi:two-component system, response regulator PdtaR